ncbi:MAG: matrixin family metalloprotease [Sandaracinaceae bacterium]
MLRGAAALFALSLLVAPRAAAFERTRVDTDPDKALFWQYRTVIVRPAYDTSLDVGASAVEAAIGRSLATWNTAAIGCSDLLLVDEGYPTGLTTNLVGGRLDMQNRIVWRESEWPAEVSPETIALTTLVYRRSTGEIEDADIDLNGVHHIFTDTDDPALARTDIENTLTHELGHLIGLAHVPDPEATMYAMSLPGDLDKRTLSADDRDGLCWVYPEGRLTPSAPRIPGSGITGGCAVGATPSGAALAVSLLGLAWLLRRRRAGR